MFEIEKNVHNFVLQIPKFSVQVYRYCQSQIFRIIVFSGIKLTSRKYKAFRYRKKNFK